MQFTNSLLALLPLVTLNSAAPVSSSAPVEGSYVALITGLPAEQFPNPEYITYATNFFGDLTLQSTTDKTAAVEWTIGTNSDLVSTTHQTIALTPPYDLPQAQSITYDVYNNTQGTYVKDTNEVVNRSPNFGSWRFCESQYGDALEYETPGFNNSNAGNPFPCYPVKFILEH